MSVTTETNQVTYTGNGVTTAYPTTFVFLDNTEVVVKVTVGANPETTLDEGTDYTLTGAGDPSGGTVTFLVAPASGTAIVIERTVPFTQPIELREQGAFSPETHEEMFDESVFRDQQLDRRVKALESAGAPGSVVAGDGLTFSSTTLHVGAGNGIVVNANDVAADFGTAGSMTAVLASGSASAGVSNKLARIDHQHVVGVGLPAAGSVAIGNAAAFGVASSVARSDHVHPITAPPAPANVNAAAASAGVATTFARSDHKHDIDTAAPSTISDSTNSEGSSDSMARADHVHSHGTRGGGTLHSDATTAVSGFMSASDKVKLDALALETISTGSCRTTDATPTEILRITPADFTAESMTAIISGKKSGASTAGGYGLGVTVKRHDGVTAQVGTATALWTHEDDAAWAVSVSIGSPNVSFYVTGVAATTIDWAITVKRTVAELP